MFETRHFFVCDRCRLETPMETPKEQPDDTVLLSWGPPAAGPDGRLELCRTCAEDFERWRYPMQAVATPRPIPVVAPMRAGGIVDDYRSAGR